MITYVGGKTYQAKHIIDHFPKDYRDMHYIEVFGGSGAVLLAKDRSYIETYNDINGDLVNLFRCVRDHYDELKERAKWVLYSREMWKDAYNCIYKTREFMDDIDRALKTAILYNQSYSFPSINGLILTYLNIKSKTVKQSKFPSINGLILTC